MAYEVVWSGRGPLTRDEGWVQRGTTSAPPDNGFPMARRKEPKTDRRLVVPERWCRWNCGRRAAKRRTVCHSCAKGLSTSKRPPGVVLPRGRASWGGVV